MRSEPESYGGLIFSALFFAVVAGAAFPLLSSGGLVFQRFTLDFHPVVPWIATGAALLVLSRVAEIVRRVLEGHPVSATSGGDDEEEGSVFGSASEDPEQEEEGDGLVPNPLLKPMAMAQGVLQGAGGAVFVGGLLTIVASIPSAISVRPDAPDTGSLYEYLQIFGSLTKWAIAAGVFYGVIRVVRVASPAFGGALAFPARQFVVLGAAYVLLSGGGVLRVAFDFPGGPILAIIILALALPYLASVVRQAITLPLPDRIQFWARILLLLCDIGWIVLVMGIMLSLPGIVGDIPALQEGGALESATEYLEILNTLALWSVILLVPFIVIRVVAAFRPSVGEVFGFPMGRIILFALALVGFSDQGVPATASSFPIPNLMPAMAAALVISYLTLVLRRVAQLGLPNRVAVPMTNIPPLIGSVMPAASASLVVWALLQFSPLITAPLLDGNATATAGQSVLFYFAGLYEVRYTLTAFFFVLVLCIALPEPLWDPARVRVRPMLVAIGFTAAGCLLWLSMAPLSGLGHIFPLLGAIVGSGLLTLALTQVAAYLSDSPEPLLSAPAQWMASSRPRGFVIGAALAFYGVLMRPLIYETLWFAAVYEWIMVLAIAIWAMFKMRGSLQTFVETAEAAPANWPRWQRHEQRFEDQPDPRRDLLSRWQQRYVESGDWTSLWTYLMGLLCRSNAPPEAIRAVIRPLRESTTPAPGRGFLRRANDADARRRESGLARSLQSAEQALTGPPNLTPVIDSDSLREDSAPYIEDGTDPEVMAGRVIAAYRRRGADTNQVVNLWFPLVSVVDRPGRWFEMPWSRRRTRAADQARRRRLVQGAISHLSGEGTMASLSVGLAARRTPITIVAMNTGQLNAIPGLQPIGGARGASQGEASGPADSGEEQESALDRMVRFRMETAATQVYVPPSPTAGAVGGTAIAAGQGFEVLEETNTSYYVRTADNRMGYVSKSALQRLPILPGDEVNTV